MKEVHGHDDQVPGDATSLKKGMLCTGAAMLQKFEPMSNICENVVGIHCYSGDIKRQVIAHHFCSVLNEDFRQCLIYDSNKKDAKLIGVEYIISEKIFKTLPDDEKKYWHSHIFEVKSGGILCPNIPNMVEKEVMKELIKTYGKTFHLWQIDRGDKIPMGPPQLMMALVDDNQINLDLVKKRDEQCGSNTEEKKKYREDMEEPKKVEGADDWYTSGKAIQLDTKEVDVKL